MDATKEKMIEGCNKCDDDISEMLLDLVGIKCSSCGRYSHYFGE